MATIFADGIFICKFLYDNIWIPNWFQLKYVPQGLIDNKPLQGQIMGCRLFGDKPLSEPMMVLNVNDVYMRLSASMSYG